MDFDFTPYFDKYEALVSKGDEAFERVQQAYAECVKCEEKCADCCHALFDLTLIEALYINHKFNEKVKGGQKADLLEKANQADRRVHKLKRQAYKDLQNGKSEDKILAELALERVRCPLLNADDLCDLYDNRPLTCRFYGIPTAIGGQGHTCGKSEFKEGEQYPTVNLDVIHNQLQKLSAELIRDLKSRYVKLADMLVPLSMALLTVYDDEYMGIGEEKAAEPPPRKKRKRRTL
ncbi:MAG: YkgJ family cysteine cluster protein [Desulfobacterales bacterium]|nr:YkgJ family cysteine cluster protein [Desulfobacterales bacterium]